MQSIPEPLFRKLCYIFHRGFMEYRKLARLKGGEQALDLTVIFEVMLAIFLIET
jgi:hypothetical protein